MIDILNRHFLRECMKIIEEEFHAFYDYGRGSFGRCFIKERGLPGLEDSLFFVGKKDDGIDSSMSLGRMACS